ncbi:MAG: GerMN domain-containing protein [Acidobacteria bacterium]|nr:GerMN domain-containing protein [Acidobacteriota bacterium]
MIPRHLQIAFALLLGGAVLLGLNILRIKQNEEEVARQASYSRPVNPPFSGTARSATLVIAYDEEGALRSQSQTVVLPEEPSARDREVLRALLAYYVERPSPHPLDPGSDVRDVYYVGDDFAVIDTTAAFAEGHRSGILVESLTVVSMVETLAANHPSVTRVKFLVDGRERDTLAGHADLRAIYDVSRVRGMVERVR